jgi:regulator of sigma E protease
MNVLHTLFFFTIAISLLVAVHEFGHFWIARCVGVKVLRFSIGFGKVLWQYQKSPQDTQYVISAIPLGGYVKMLDEREGEVNSNDLSMAFNRQSLGARTAIVAAGPFFNLILAVALFWGVLVIGETGIKPIIGNAVPGSVAELAGFVEGDEVLAVDDKPTPTWMHAISTIIASAFENDGQVKVTVRNRDDMQVTRALIIAAEDRQHPDKLYSKLGLRLWSPPLAPIIGKVLVNSAAEVAGLQQGDLIVRIDDIAIKEWQQLVEIIKANPNRTMVLNIEREGVLMHFPITPSVQNNNGQAEGRIGASVLIPEQLIKSAQINYSLSPLDAIPEAFLTTYRYSSSTLKMIGQMLGGKASLENLSGPISIAQYAGQSANMGLVHFLKFLGLISVSLGVLNLLPIPVLDGGHLFFFCIECISGRPVSEKMQLFFQKIGIAFLSVLMLTAMFMDLGRVVQSF